MLLINGHQTKYLDVNDRAIQFGDGCFTTARVINGDICLLNAHLSRLKEACEKLFIPFIKWDILTTEMKLLSKHIRHGVIKIIITRGKSEIGGYSINKCTYPNRILFVFPYPHFYNHWRNLGITLTLSRIRIGRNAKLAGIKHLNRLEQVLIRADLDRSQTNADEALVLDSEGIVRECCSSNLFWRYGYNVFTPRLDQAGVNGIMRQFIISKLINSPFRVIEIDTSHQMIFDSDEVLVCNSIMPIVPVRAYGKKHWTSRKLYQFLVSLCKINTEI